MKVTTLFSPAAAPLADPTSPVAPNDIETALLGNGIRFVVLSADSPLSAALYHSNPRLAAFAARPPVGEYRGLRIYDLLVSPQPAALASPSERPPASP